MVRVHSGLPFLSAPHENPPGKSHQGFRGSKSGMFPHANAQFSDVRTRAQLRVLCQCHGHDIPATRLGFVQALVGDFEQLLGG